MDEAMVRKKMGEIGGLETAELLAEFRREFGFESRTHSPETLRRRLQHRTQENAFGGLTDEELELLDRIADSEPETTRHDTRRILRLTTPGTRLQREYQGKTYEVTIERKGCFIFEGRPYRSLSGIAREITGVNWNGKRFFGVR